MDPRGSAIIDFIEAAYHLQTEPDDWLSALIRAGVPVLERGLGVFALTLLRPPEPGPVVIDRVHLELGPPGLTERIARLQGELYMRLLWPLTRPGMPKTMSEVTRDHDPVLFEQIMRHFDFAKDGVPSQNLVVGLEPISKPLEGMARM